MTSCQISCTVEASPEAGRPTSQSVPRLVQDHRETAGPQLPAGPKRTSSETGLSGGCVPGGGGIEGIWAEDEGEVLCCSEGRDGLGGAAVWCSCTVLQLQVSKDTGLGACQDSGFFFTWD